MISSVFTVRVSLPSLSRDWLARWYVVVTCAALSLIGMSAMRVSAPFIDSLATFARFAAIFVACGLMLAVVSVSRYAQALKVASDFLLTLGQHIAFITAAIALPYIAASLNTPLRDAALQRLDLLLGFDWYAAARWTGARPWILTALMIAYGSMFFQTLVALWVYRARGEFTWIFMTLLLACIAVSAFVPAFGQPGMIGVSHIEALEAARAGVINQMSGIITFPSFHAALGVLFIYAARESVLLSRIAWPLNLLLIVSTPMCGGHYLSDTIAGIALALGVILTHCFLRIVRQHNQR